MSFTVGLLTLALLPAYICRLNALHLRVDPWWDVLGTYLFFVGAVKAGSAAVMSEVEPWHVVALVLALLWIVATYHRWAERSLSTVGK